MHICHREHLHQVDLLSPVEKKITDREYRAKHTGQKKLDTLNKEMLSKLFQCLTSSCSEEVERLVQATATRIRSKNESFLAFIFCGLFVL